MPQSDGGISGGNAAIAAVAAYETTPATPAIPANPETIPTGSTPTAAEELITKAMGRQYQIRVIYCEGVTSDAKICSEKYRNFFEYSS